MTGPRVLRGRETSILWFGIRGVWMARGVLGMTPKLGKRKKGVMRAALHCPKYVKNTMYLLSSTTCLIFPLLLSTPAATPGREHSSSEQTK